MKKLLNRVRNEDGALTFEFLGIVPLFFMFFLLLWQVVASGYAVYTLKMAVNEGAKTYSATKSYAEAETRVLEALGSSSVIQYSGMSITNLDGSGKFELEVKANHFLIFVPSQWKDDTALSFDDSAVSKVLVQ
jgi:hypothetical protein